MSTKKITKPYTQMTTAELRVATKQFDDLSYHPPALKPGPKERRDQRLAGRLGKAMKAGRPRIGLGAERVQIALERGLRCEVDLFAKQRKLSRSRIIADALRQYIQTAA
jgi:hypothetical protein